MKVALINGSPKTRGSSSEYLLRMINKLLYGFDEIIHIKIPLDNMNETIINQLFEMDVWVFAFPTYYAGIPSHVLKSMEILKKWNNRICKKIYIYSIVNCGFYCGLENKFAISMIQNWCLQSNFIFGQGVGVGCGGLLGKITVQPIGKILEKKIKETIEILAANISLMKKENNLYVEANVPCFVYNKASKLVWNNMAKKNGLLIEDIGNKKVPFMK